MRLLLLTAVFAGLGLAQFTPSGTCGNPNCNVSGNLTVGGNATIGTTVLAPLVCDGVTDNGPRINSLISAAASNATVLINAGSSGTCVVSTPLVMSSKNYITLDGNNVGIYFTGTGDGFTISGGQNDTVQNLSFLGNGTNGGNGLTVSSSTRLTLRNNLIYNFSHNCVYANESWWLTDYGSTLSTPGSGYSALYLDSESNNDAFYHSYFSPVGGIGVTAASGSAIHFVSVDVTGASTGILALTPIVVEGAYFEGNTIGVQLGNSSNVPNGSVISGNYFNTQGANGIVGISNYNSGYNRIASNVFVGNNPTNTSTAISIANNANNTRVWVDPDSNTYTTVTTGLSDPNGLTGNYNVSLATLGVAHWGNSSGVVDTGFSRLAAGTVALGNGTQGDATGVLELSRVVTSQSGYGTAYFLGNGFNIYAASPGAGFAAIGTSDNTNFYLNVNGSHVIALTPGKVGIGSTTPGSLLTVKGGDAFVDGTATGVILRDTVVTTNCYRITIASGVVTPTLTTCPTD